MAAISSVTGSGLTAPTYNWNDIAAWQGGVVPTSADDVTIRAFSTTINQSAISKWTSGTITITVASTSGFPATGYFYTGTSRGEVLKINYTGLTGTTFTGCTLDLTDSFYYWDLGGQISNGAYVHSPAPIINIPTGVTASCNSLTVLGGGWLNIAAGGILRSYSFITHRDGRIIGKGSAGSVGKIQITRTEPNIGFYTAENYQMSILDLDGGETRTYAALTSPISTGGGVATIGTATNGSFAVGDEIAIYDSKPGAKGKRTRLYTVFRDTTQDFRAMDEGFDVVGVSGSNLYLGRRNGARGTIKQSSTLGSQKILTVDKNDHLSQMNFKAGDKVVINNAVYTVDKVEESTYDVATYDFQSGSTLSDFIANEDISIEDAWSLDAYGAYASNTSFNALVNKSIWRREIQMEVEMSPLSQYTTGTRGTDQFGLIFNYDPSWRKGHRTGVDSVKTGNMKINDSTDTMLINERATTASDWMIMSRDADGLKTLVQTPRTYKLDLRNNMMKIYIDNEQIYERFQTSGGMRGLFGVYAWNNTNARFKRITYRAACQNLYITTTDTFTNGHVVYESGAEIAHATGRRVLKLSSRISNIEGHDDLAFAYRGAYDSGVWPVVNGLNADSNTNIAATWIINHDMNIDYYHDLGTTANRFITLDLTKQRTFTHVTFTPRAEEMGSLPGMNGVTIYGSNDGSTWTTIYATANDTKRYQNSQWYNQLGIYAVGTQSYRYIKFLTNGHSGTANTTYNRYVNVGVHDFSAGFKITLNNASDFAVGDIISVLCHNGWYSVDDSQTYTAVKAAQNPDTYLWTANTHSTITAISGNTLTLSSPINWGYLEGGETVVKVNRNFKVEGLISKGGGTLWQKPYFRYNSGTSTPMVRWLTNVYFEHVGSSRISSSNWNRGIDLSQQDYNNPAIVDSCSFECYNGSGANGLTFQAGTAIVRNCYIANLYEYRPAYNAGYCGVATFNNKFNNIFRPYLENFRDGMFNYNEVASAYQLYNVEGIGYDLYTAPDISEFRRNNFHGQREIPGFYATGYGAAGGITPIIRNEYNRVYATNAVAYTQRPTANVVSAVGWDIHAEHPGQRLSQYRSEGFTAWWNTNDASDPYSGVNDFLRADYDFAVCGIYHMTVRFKSADYLRAYTVNSDGQLPFMALRVYRNAAVPIKMYVEFDYRHPMRYNRIQNANGDYSSFRVGCVNNGTHVTNSPQNTTSPATINSDGWQTFSYTFDAIPTEIGNTALWIGRGANTTFVDIRNVRAYVMTDNPQNVFVINNTFDTNKTFNLVNDKKDTRPISAATPLKARRLKL